MALMVGATWLTFFILPGLDDDGSWVTIAIVGLLIAAANAVVIPLLKAIALPLRIVTLGLATLAINVAVITGVIVVAQNVELGISSDGLGTTILAGLMLTVLSSVISWVVRD